MLVSFVQSVVGHSDLLSFPQYVCWHLSSAWCSLPPSQVWPGDRSVHLQRAHVWPTLWSGGVRVLLHRPGSLYIWSRGRQVRTGKAPPGAMTDGSGFQIFQLCVASPQSQNDWMNSHGGQGLRETKKNWNFWKSNYGWWVVNLVPSGSDSSSKAPPTGPQPHLDWCWTGQCPRRSLPGVHRGQHPSLHGVWHPHPIWASGRFGWNVALPINCSNDKWWWVVTRHVLHNGHLLSWNSVDLKEKKKV